MVLFWLMWLCLVLGAAVCLLGDQGRFGLRLVVAPGAALPGRSLLRRRARDRWPPGEGFFPSGPRRVPRAGPRTRLTA